MLSTPGGKPTSLRSSPSSVAVSGVTSDGLATTRVARRQRRRDLPGEQVQRQVPRRDAADHAERLAQRVVQCRPAHGAIRWRTACAAWAKKRRLLTARGISISRASRIGLPPSRDSARANSSSFACSASARRLEPAGAFERRQCGTTRERPPWRRRRHAPTSSALPSATWRERPARGGIEYVAPSAIGRIRCMRRRSSAGNASAKLNAWRARSRSAGPC